LRFSFATIPHSRISLFFSVQPRGGMRRRISTFVFSNLNPTCNFQLHARRDRCFARPVHVFVAASASTPLDKFTGTVVPLLGDDSVDMLL
jgi:hypothetical protein